MYIVPQSAPAASAAATPRAAWPPGAWVDDATASSVAPANIAVAPPSTPSRRARPASRSSLKNTTPHTIPSRLFAFQLKRDAQADVFDREDGDGVGDGPEASGEHRPHGQVRSLAQVGAYRGRAAQQGWHAPAGEKHAEHHRQRDHHGGDPERHHLGRRLGRPEPRARGEAAQYAHLLQPVEPAGGYRIHQSTPRPSSRTATGTQNWASRSMAARRPVTSAPRRSGRRRVARARPRAAPAARCSSARPSWGGGSADGTDSRAAGGPATAPPPPERYARAGPWGPARARRRGARSCTGVAARRTARRRGRALRSSRGTSPPRRPRCA